ncbi:MAG: sugar transferase [Acidobacteria bacterium]|nr:sugar transferase [Acidobacteriota bacterium]
MRRIVLLTTGLARGGAEAQVVLLALNLSRRGWNVRVVSMLPPQAHEEDLRNARIPVLDLGMRKGIPDPRAIFRLAGSLREFRPHILHCHMVHANLLGRITRLLAPVPVLISTAHSIHEGHRWRDWAYRWTDRWCDLTTNVCRTGWERYVREGLAARDKAKWIPNGVDPGLFHRNEQAREALRREFAWHGRFVWLAVGNLLEPKDYANLLDAFARLPADSAASVLAIAGSGPLEGILTARIRELGVVDKVRLLGSRQDVPDLLQAADAYVMSSAWEGTPMALLEAAAAALPIIATEVGGTRDVVEHPRTGLLVPPRDPAALALAMRRLMTMSPRDRIAMGDAAQQRIHRLFGQQRIVRRWENVYNQLLETRAGASPNADASHGSLEGFSMAQILKRAIDLFSAATVLIVLSPLLLLLALLVRSCSPGPAFFRQSRLGRNGARFAICKFRTMYQNASDLRNPDGSAISLTDDPRVTPLGRFLRRTSLDELPQLWNVIRGEMSLVGPRPDQADQIRHYTTDEMAKLAMRPGITGLAQISGRNSIPWEKRKQLDRRYVEQWSLALDLSILFKTIPYVLLRRDVHQEQIHGIDDFRATGPESSGRIL